MNLEHFKKIKELIVDSEIAGPLAKTRGLGGFSGGKLIGTLQRIAKYQESIGGGCYLEIGVFQGLSLLSVASVLEQDVAYGVDNFAQFDPDKRNQSIIKERADQNNITNFNLINSDYEDVLENLGTHLEGRKIGTYFVDGPHDYRSQLICLQLAKRHLSDYAVILIDDSNYRHVRLANRDFLVANPEFKLLFEAYTESHPANMDTRAEENARQGWWDGINILVYDPLGELERMLPETIRDRRLYENEHIVHSMKYGVMAPEAVSLFQSVRSFRLLRAFRQFVRMSSALSRSDKTHIGDFESLNTFSASLTAAAFNPKL